MTEREKMSKGDGEMGSKGENICLTLKLQLKEKEGCV